MHVQVGKVMVRTVGVSGHKIGQKKMGDVFRQLEVEFVRDNE